MSFTTDKESDNYITLKEDWERILKYVDHDKKIWCPFYCNGEQKVIFNELGFDIIHEDKDFFSYTPKYDILIDNPPFSKIKDILKKLKELDKPFILICPNHTFQYRFFQRPFGKYLQLIIPNRRVKFKHLTRDIKQGSLPFDCYYFCYKMELEKDLIFIE
tara:strand:+ start:6134 stop:6613 length:480 start_codon:yes stop_codon:yes gene_type:complete